MQETSTPVIKPSVPRRSSPTTGELELPLIGWLFVVVAVADLVGQVIVVNTALDGWWDGALQGLTSVALALLPVALLSRVPDADRSHRLLLAGLGALAVLELALTGVFVYVRIRGIAADEITTLDTVTLVIQSLIGGAFLLYGLGLARIRGSAPIGASRWILPAFVLVQAFVPAVQALPGPSSGSGQHSLDWWFFAVNVWVAVATGVAASAAVAAFVDRIEPRPFWAVLAGAFLTSLVVVIVAASASQAQARDLLGVDAANAAITLDALASFLAIVGSVVAFARLTPTSPQPSPISPRPPIRPRQPIRPNHRRRSPRLRLSDVCGVGPAHATPAHGPAPLCRRILAGMCARSTRSVTKVDSAALEPDPVVPMPTAHLIGHGLGVDIGGTGIKAAVVDLATGKLLTDRIREATPQPATPDAMMRVIADVARQLQATGFLTPDVPGGAGFPSVIRGGHALTATNLDSSWIGAPVQQLLEDALGRPMLVLNDADAAGVAEVAHGAGKGHHGVILMLTIGTGIGSALFINGQLVPNLQLGHLELHGHEAESRLSGAAKVRRKIGWKAWAHEFDDFLGYLERYLWPDLIILGGGVSTELPKYQKYLRSSTPLVAAAMLNTSGIVGAAMAGGNAARAKSAHGADHTTGDTGRPTPKPPTSRRRPAERTSDRPKG